LKLRFDKSVCEIAAKRITYVVETFRALWGVDEIDQWPEIYYGDITEEARDDVVISATYVVRSSKVALSPPVWVSSKDNAILQLLGIEKFPCFHASVEGHDIDWLGEAFEWLSGADEYAIQKRDSINRIAYDDSLFSRFNIDPTVPWAGICFAALNILIQKTRPLWPDRPVSPFGCNQTVMGASHDVDFIPVSKKDIFKRYWKNIAIALLAVRDTRLALKILYHGIPGVGPGLHGCLYNCIAREQALGVTSSYNIIATKKPHHRDCWYHVDKHVTQEYLNHIIDNNMELGLHGSYTSMQTKGSLAKEAKLLRSAGYEIIGNRQHWLRFSGSELYEEVIRAELSYDSTLGFSGHIGFRNGACFPFRPYHFEKETAYPLLEIPLVMMDVAMEGYGWDAKRLYTDANKVLEMVRKFSWGGVSILWHDTVFSGAQIAMPIAELYWKLVSSSDKWVSLGEIYKHCASRYDLPENKK